MGCRELYDQLKSTDNLPSPKGVAMEILRACEDDDVSVGKLADIVSKDPAISARLLQAVNSPVTGVNRAITSVQDASSLLGCGSVQALALAFSLLEDNREGKCELFDYERFWSRSLACAVAMRRLAAEGDVMPPDEAFTYGLLSRIGRLGLVSVLPERYAEVLTSIDRFTDQALSLAEERVFQTGTDWLTALMIHDWGLPRMCEFLDPNRDENDKDLEMFGGILHLASAMAAVLIAPDVTADLVENVHQTARALGADDESLEQVFETIADEWRAAGAELGIRTRPVGALSELVES